MPLQQLLLFPFLLLPLLFLLLPLPFPQLPLLQWRGDGPQRREALSIREAGGWPGRAADCPGGSLLLLGRAPPWWWRRRRGGGGLWLGLEMPEARDQRHERHWGTPRKRLLLLFAIALPLLLGGGGDVAVLGLDVLGLCLLEQHQ